MAMFMVRVELHRASGADYDDLHEAMEDAGFTRTVKGTNDNRYQLPTAEYDFEGNYSPSLVHDAAKRAAESTGCDSAVMVSQYTNLTFSGLTEVV